MKIGIYGGTFNPPHLGHLAAARTALDALKLDKLILMPAAVPPHKVLPENSPAQEHRLAMVERMADAMERPGAVEVSTLELEREGKSYTSDTLEAIHRQYPEAELWLLMGTDMFLTLHLWHEPGTILRLAGICAFGRSEQDGEAVFAPQREFLSKTYPDARIATITLPGLVDISSTQLRELLARERGREYLLPSVYGYILMNRLYGTYPCLKHLELPELRACSYSLIRHKRVAHVIGVEEAAVKLAKFWGADPELARHAGIFLFRKSKNRKDLPCVNQTSDPGQKLCQNSCKGRPCYPHRNPDHKYNIQNHIQHTRNNQEHQRHHRIPQRTQNRRDPVIQHRSRCPGKYNHQIYRCLIKQII